MTDTNTEDDIQSIPLEIIGQTQQQLNEDVVINQPLPDSISINTQSIHDSYRYPMTCTGTATEGDNTDMMSVARARNPRNDYHVYTGNISDIYNYTIWSIFNMFLCSPGIGLYALFMSLEISKKKRRGDHLSARNTSNIVGLLNIVCTFSGLLFYIIGGLRLSGYFVMYKPAL